MHVRLPVPVLAFVLCALLPGTGWAGKSTSKSKAMPSACKGACDALKKVCPEGCKESGSKAEQDQCLQGCPAEVRDCEKNCPAMEARARAHKLGEPAMDIIKLPPDGDEGPRHGSKAPPDAHDAPHEAGE